MLERTKLMLVASVALPLSLLSAHGALAYAQDHPAPTNAGAQVRPDAPAPAPERGPAPPSEASTAPTSHTEEVATASAPPAAESAARPASAEREAPPPAPVGRPRLPELASAATCATPPPAPSAAMRELDAVLSGEPGDPLATMQPVERPAATLETPSREETAAAVELVLPGVRACVANGVSGVVVLRIVFISNGHATTVDVQSHFARLSPEQRGCIARAARRAQVSAFQRSHFTTSYPIRL